VLADGSIKEEERGGELMGEEDEIDLLPSN
jgi:hypothetical protein